MRKTLKTNNETISALYQRRAMIAVMGFAILTGGATTLSNRAVAQPPAESNPGRNATEVFEAKKKQTEASKSGASEATKTEKKAPKKSSKVNPPITPTLEIKPTPRKDVVSRAVPPPQTGTPPNTGAPLTQPLPQQPIPQPQPSGTPPRGTKFTFDFKGSDITNVLKLFSMMSGKTITTDPGLSGPVTIINPKQVTLDDAFKILQSVLIVRGYTALEAGDVIQILPFDKAKSATTIVSPETEPLTLDPKNQVMTQVIPLENVDAEAMAKDLLPLISAQASLIGSAGSNALIMTDTSSNIRRFIELVNALDKTSSHSKLVVYPLKHAEAMTVSTTINDLYKQITSRGKGGAPPQPGQPNFGQPGQPSAGSSARPAVVAVPDIRTNSVIVVASPENQEQVANDIINRLDDDNSSALDTEIIPVKYANAQEVANLVNTVLSNMHGTPASGGAGGGGRSFGGFNPFGFGGGGGGDASSTQSTDPFGKVIADPRTNSLFVTANPERMDKIKDLIAKIDVNVPVETTTFVIPLKNAQASDVAYALSQAFSTGNNNNNGGYNNYNIFGGGGSGNSRQRQPIQRRQGASTNPFGNSRSIRNGAPPPPNSPDPNANGDNPDGANGGSAIPQGVAGVMTDQGFVPLDNQNNAISNAQAQGANGDRTRQYYFGGYGYGGGRGQVGSSNGPQYGRGTNGSYSNLLRLQNNVFVNASPDGESLIVTTTPDNYKTLLELINQLDVVPRQVMVEVIVAEVSLDTSQKFGFNLNGLLRRLFSSNTNIQGQISNPANGFGASTILDQTASGTQAVLSGTNFTAIIQALNADNKVKVLSTPRVFTSNGQQATFESVVNVPYINGQTSSSFVSTNVSNQVEYIKIGLTLNVTPRITRDGKVTIDLTQETSDLIQFDSLGNNIRAPRYNDRYADTSVTIQDGQTVVVGGIIRENDTITTSKVPILAEIPLVGQFFKSREKSRSKTELMIFMTPHIVETDKQAREMTLKTAEPVIKQIPDLSNQQPNLKLKKGSAPDKMSGDKRESPTEKAEGKKPEMVKPADKIKE